MKKKILLLTSLFASLFAFSQYNYRSPLDIPLILAANFGELRANHFHTGLDLKTQGVVNKNVYSIEDGYVSRIGVNAGGYGLVLYINHPNGHTSVYAHLNSFSSKIAAYTKAKQYEKETYVINIKDIAPNELPVKRGELIALSGNTGSSGGPHVHFELRDTETEIVLDPLPYFLNQIADKVSPEIRGIAIYPITGEGIVNGSINPFRENLTVGADGSYPALTNIKAWGKIGLGIHSIDRMNGTHNIYGVKEVNLYCDEDKIFSSDISTIDFTTTRMINSFTDFDYWSHNKRFFMKSFIEPGNKLHIYDGVKRGYININEEKTYNFRYELEDVHGNKTNYRFSVEGVKREIPIMEPCSLVMHWNENNRYINDHFKLIIPKGYLYKDINFLLRRTNSDKYFSQIYEVNDNYEPLDNYVDMTLQLNTDTLIDTSKYGVVSINNKGKESWIGGEYAEGYITTKVRELGGRYAVSSDTQAPTITPVSPTNWVKNNRIVIRLTDNLSGIASYRGTIDGEYALFEYDIKLPNRIYKLDPTKLKKGKKHTLEFTTTDSAGNTATYSTTFTY